MRRKPTMTSALKTARRLLRDERAILLENFCIYANGKRQRETMNAVETRAVGRYDYAIGKINKALR